ncbi:MAG: hypothetical protein ACTSQZ_01425 [Candidatus Thorarchaeota archaeon]
MTISAICISSSKDETSFMVRLRKTGMSYSEIGEKLFDKYGYTIDARDIRNLILRDKQTKRE